MTIPTGVGAKNYLQLCQRVAKYAGVGSASVQLLPTSVVGQVGELSRIVDYVADAWTELQGDKRWSWMWETPTLTVPYNQFAIPQDISADRYVFESAYVPSVSSDNAGHHLDYLPWDEFSQLYPRMLTGSSLGVWSIRPDNAFCINGLAPVDGYQVRVERYAAPTELHLDTDVPGMPADLHMLIVYGAVRKYGQFDEAGAQIKINAAEERRLRSQLVTRCMPAPRLGGSILDYL